eukprot:scpid103412/ scgid33490/ 
MAAASRAPTARLPPGMSMLNPSASVQATNPTHDHQGIHASPLVPGTSATTFNNGTIQNQASSVGASKATQLSASNIASATAPGSPATLTNALQSSGVSMSNALPGAASDLDFGSDFPEAGSQDDFAEIEVSS